MAFWPSYCIALHAPVLYLHVCGVVHLRIRGVFIKYLCTPMATGKQLYRQYQCILQYSYDDSLANIISDSDFVFYQYYKLHEYTSSLDVLPVLCPNGSAIACNAR